MQKNQFTNALSCKDKIIQHSHKGFYYPIHALFDQDGEICSPGLGLVLAIF